MFLANLDAETYPDSLGADFDGGQHAVFEIGVVELRGTRRRRWLGLVHSDSLQNESEVLLGQLLRRNVFRKVVWISLDFVDLHLVHERYRHVAYNNDVDGF